MIKGRGAYKITKEDLLSGGSKVGEWIGSQFGLGGIGSDLGRGIGGIISKITGRGDYKVSSNSLLVSPTVPQFAGADGGIRVRHREFLRDVISTTGFTTIEIPINPGAEIFAPWLSMVAKNFEFYDMMGCVFEYRPLSGVYNATSPALGYVGLATEYDVTAEGFDTKQQAESTIFSVAVVPTNPALHAIECARKQGLTENLLVRDGPIPTNGTPQFYDLGRTTLFTGGMPANGYVCGELWVTYDVVFRKQKIPPCIPGRQFAFTNTLIGNLAVLGGGTPTVYANQIPVYMNANALFFKSPGVFQVCVQWHIGTYTGTTTVPVAALGTNLVVSPPNMWGNTLARPALRVAGPDENGVLSPVIVFNVRVERIMDKNNVGLNSMSFGLGDATAFTGDVSCCVTCIHLP